MGIVWSVTIQIASARSAQQPAQPTGAATVSVRSGLVVGARLDPRRAARPPRLALAAIEPVDGGLHEFVESRQRRQLLIGR